MMHYIRQPLIGDRDPWNTLFIDIDKNELGLNKPQPIINIAGSAFLHRHEITFLTGTSHCRAHALAKMVAAAALHGSYPFAQSLQVAQIQTDNNEQQHTNKVLWIDSVHSLYTVCGMIDDLKRNFNINNDNFRMMCLDSIGTFNERDKYVHSAIIDAIRDFKPTLVVFDDLDHLTPECGMMRADNFYLAIREILDFYNTSILCVAYNLIGRTKATAGHIGKVLFPIANNVFRVTNRVTTTIVQRVKGITCDDQVEFAFTINDQNFPQEVILTPDNSTAEARFTETTAVQDIFTSVIPKDQTITPDELIKRLNKRRNDMNRLNSNRHLIANALARGILNRNNDGHYTINNEYYNNNGNMLDNGFIDDYIRNLKKTTTIPIIPVNTPPSNLTFLNQSARHSITSRDP